MSLSRSVISGASWAYVSHFGGKLLTFAATAVLARVLFPSEFGVVAFALVVLGLIDVVRDFGFKDALIYLDGAPADTADTAFFLNLCSGVIFCALILLLAPFAAHFIDDSRIVSILRIMAPAVLIDSLSLTHEGLLQKRLQFRQRFAADITAVIVKSTITIVLAFSGFNVWSLVIGYLAGTTTRTLARWYWLDWRPRWRWFGERVGPLWRYGRHILAVRILAAFVDRADQIMVAFLLGEAKLGLFYLAGRVSEVLISSIYNVVTHVIFPVFAKMREKREQLLEAYFKTTKICAMASFPLGFGVCVVAPELVIVLFGEAWTEAIPLLRVLTLTGIALTLPWSAGDVVKAIGRPDINTVFHAVEAVYILPIVWFVAYQSRDALLTAEANMVCVLFASLCRIVYTSWFLKLKATFYLSAFRGPFLSSLAMVVVVLLWRSQTPDLSNMVSLVGSVACGALSYMAVLWLLEKREIVDAYHRIRDNLRSA